MVGERWKRLVGEFFCGGGILFGGGKVEKYHQRYLIDRFLEYLFMSVRMRKSIKNSRILHLVTY